MAAHATGQASPMSPAPTTVTVVPSDGERRLDVHGDLDVEGASALRAALEETLQDGSPEALVVDLSDVEFVDSLGLSGLLRCARDAHLAGATLRVFAPHGHQARVLFDLSGTA